MGMNLKSQMTATVIQRMNMELFPIKNVMLTECFRYISMLVCNGVVNMVQSRKDLSRTSNFSDSRLSTFFIGTSSSTYFFLLFFYSLISYNHSLIIFIIINFIIGQIKFNHLQYFNQTDAEPFMKSN